MGNRLGRTWLRQNPSSRTKIPRARNLSVIVGRPPRFGDGHAARYCSRVFPCIEQLESWLGARTAGGRDSVLAFPANNPGAAAEAALMMRQQSPSTRGSSRGVFEGSPARATHRPKNPSRWPNVRGGYRKGPRTRETGDATWHFLFSKPNGRTVAITACVWGGSSPSRWLRW